MAHQQQRNVIDQVMELLIDHGFDSMADVLKILFNEAMKIEREDALDARSRIRSKCSKPSSNGLLKTDIRDMIVLLFDLSEYVCLGPNNVRRPI